MYKRQVRQFRYAMQQELWELPAGKLDYLLSMLNVWLFFAPMAYRLSLIHI